MRFVLPLLPPALLGLACWPAVPLGVRIACGVGFMLLYLVYLAWQFRRLP